MPYIASVDVTHLGMEDEIYHAKFTAFCSVVVRLGVLLYPVPPRHLLILPADTHPLLIIRLRTCFPYQVPNLL